MAISFLEEGSLTAIKSLEAIPIRGAYLCCPQSISGHMWSTFPVQDRHEVVMGVGGVCSYCVLQILTSFSSLVSVSFIHYSVSCFSPRKEQPSIYVTVVTQNSSPLVSQLQMPKLPEQSLLKAY